MDIVMEILLLIIVLIGSVVFAIRSTAENEKNHRWERELDEWLKITSRNKKGPVQTQEALNKKAKIGIKPIKPALNQDRIDGLIEKNVEAEQYDDAAWALNEPIVNFAQSIVDDSAKANADFMIQGRNAP
ncbi:hypothetical protein ABB02_00374 [Clostridiaceae bacterium JG1575]|nr:hypothetical protein ABB02_00374 [Clostridiaceae bacterium JG1575]